MAITTNGGAGLAADTTATLTNKTINLSGNTLTGNLTEFNTALSGADFVSLAGSETLTNKTISLTSNSVSGTLAEFNTALSGADFVSLAGSETLTNKTLTSPVLGGTTTTASGNLVVEPATFILEVKGGGATVGQIQLNCPVNSHGQKIASQPHAESATNTLTLPGGTTIGDGNATLVSDTGTQTLTNKTLTSPTINGAFTNSVNELIVRGFEEDVYVVASAATGTINFDVATASIWYYTSNASANHTVNFRYNSSNSLSSKLAVGDAITLVWMNTNGSSAYYPNTIQIDGSAVTPKVPAAISSGNASAIDVYTFTIIKTAATPTYTVLETQQKFA